MGDGWTELERYLEWMARAHYTFAKGETQVIDLSQFTRGYDGGTYTVSAPSGVTATVSGSRLTVKLADSFVGAGYIKFTLKDNAGDTFSRYIGVTQGLAVNASQGGQDENDTTSVVAGDTTATGDSTTTSLRPRAQRMHLNGLGRIYDTQGRLLKQRKHRGFYLTR